jgi:hypothetical protein
VFTLRRIIGAERNMRYLAELPQAATGCHTQATGRTQERFRAKLMKLKSFVGLPQKCSLFLGRNIYIYSQGEYAIFSVACGALIKSMVYVNGTCVATENELY